MARRGTNRVIWNTVVAAGAMLGTAACGGKQTRVQAPAASAADLPGDIAREPEARELPPPPLPVETALPPAPLTFTLTVESTPAGADVWSDGALVGKTPIQLPPMTEGTSVDLKLVRDGHLAKELTVVADADKAVAVTLEAAAPRPRVIPGKRKHGRGFVLA